jgi:hypothetical protein
MYKEVMEKLKEEHWFVVHLTDQACNVCEIVGMKLEEELMGIDFATYVPLSTNVDPTLLTTFSVVQFPTVLIMYANKTYKRYERVFSIEDIIKDLNRYIELSK